MTEKHVRVGGRGTSRRIASKEDQNWAGSAFSNLQKKRKEQSKDRYISVGRGTGKIKFGDISTTTVKTSGKKGRWVRTGRGTGKIWVE